MRVGRSCSGRRPSARICSVYCNSKLNTQNPKQLFLSLEFRVLSGVSLSDQRDVPREGAPDVDVSGKCVDLFAVDENLHALHGGKVRGHRVDERVDGHQLVERSARMRARNLWAQ